jgi:hypothetical protein
MRRLTFRPHCKQITENRFIVFLSEALFHHRGRGTDLSKKHGCGKNSASAKLSSARERAGIVLIYEAAGFDLAFARARP